MGDVVSKELELIAEHGYSFRSWGSGMNLACDCGNFSTAGPYSTDEMRKLHAAHVVSKLSEHGYSIEGPSEVRALDAVRQELDDYEAGEYSGIEYDLPSAIRTIVGKSAAAAEEDQ